MVMSSDTGDRMGKCLRSEYRTRDCQKRKVKLVAAGRRLIFSAECEEGNVAADNAMVAKGGGQVPKRLSIDCQSGIF